MVAPLSVHGTAGTQGNDTTDFLHQPLHLSVDASASVRLCPQGELYRDAPLHIGHLGSRQADSTAKRNGHLVPTLMAIQTVASARCPPPIHAAEQNAEASRNIEPRPSSTCERSRDQQA